MVSIKEQRRIRREGRKKDRLEAFRKVTNIPEVLAMIFICCLPKVVTRPHRKRAPLNIAHVCKYWRDVAHSTPELWSSIQLQRVNLDQRTMLRHISLIEHWLSLSSNLLLTIHIHYPFCDKLLPYDSLEGIIYVQDPMYNRVVYMLDFVSKHSGKLQEVVVATKRGLLLPMIHMLRRGSPNLQKCHLLLTKGDTSVYEDIEHMPTLFVNLARCPKLQELKFVCEPAEHLIALRSTPSLVSLEILGFDLSFQLGQPTTSLKRLVLRHLPDEIGDGYSWGTIQSISALFPALNHLEITFTGRNSDVEGLSELAFPELRSLRVTTKMHPYDHSGDDEAEHFFNHLSAPALKSLRLDSGRSFIKTDPEHSPCVKNLILRSNADLDTLILKSVKLADDDILSLLECAPNLHVLYLSGRHLTDRLVSRLTLQHQATGQVDLEKDLCPHLRDLTLCLGQVPASQQSVMKLVASRREEYEDNPDSGVLLRFGFNMIQQPGLKPQNWHPDIHKLRSQKIDPEAY